MKKGLSQRKHKTDYRSEVKKLSDNEVLNLKFPLKANHLSITSQLVHPKSVPDMRPHVIFTICDHF